jgi:hypothetical protein
MPSLRPLTSTTRSGGHRAESSEITGPSVFQVPAAHGDNSEHCPIPDTGRSLTFPAPRTPGALTIPARAKADVLLPGAPASGDGRGERLAMSTQAVGNGNRL